MCFSLLYAAYIKVSKEISFKKAWYEPEDLEKRAEKLMFTKHKQRKI